MPGSTKPGHEEVDPCLICLEELQKEQTSRRLPCGHVFHASCFYENVHAEMDRRNEGNDPAVAHLPTPEPGRRWVQHLPTCPKCRHELRPESAAMIWWGAQCRMFNVVETNQTRELQLAIDAGADVNLEADSGGDRALLNAAYLGHEETTQMLLANNADANLSCCEKFTPLMYASRQGHLGIVTMLLDAKASVNAQCADGKSALHYAVAYKSSSSRRDCVVRELLARGADVDIRSIVTSTSESGCTPLLDAVCNSHIGAVQILLDNNADPNAVQELSQRVRHNLQRYNGDYDPWDVLRRAVCQSSSAVKMPLVGMLLKHGARPEEFHVQQAGRFHDVADLLREHITNS